MELKRAPLLDLAAGPEQGATNYSYNPDDTVQTVTDARTAATTFTYNPRKLVEGITFSVPSVAGVLAPAEDGEHHFNIRFASWQINYRDLICHETLEPATFYAYCLCPGGFRGHNGFLQPASESG